VTAADAGEITTLLRAWSEGDAGARDRLASLVYTDLRRVAAARLRHGAAPTLSPSDLVHEAFVRMLRQEPRWANRAHFFAVAAAMIRRVLADHARARAARKRGGGAVRVEIGDLAAAPAADVDVAALDQALTELAGLDPAQAAVVELRYFGGLTFEEIAEVRRTSVSTAKRDWASARLWLNWRLQPAGQAGTRPR
jgi:RNA polymerase sigma factor (TIGR02999 family)